MLHADALRKTYGRQSAFALELSHYADASETWGRLPVVIICGDELQLPPVPMQHSLCLPLWKERAMSTRPEFVSFPALNMSIDWQRPCASMTLCWFASCRKCVQLAAVGSRRRSGLLWRELMWNQGHLLAYGKVQSISTNAAIPGRWFPWRTPVVASQVLVPQVRRCTPLLRRIVFSICRRTVCMGLVRQFLRTPICHFAWQLLICL